MKTYLKKVFKYLELKKNKETNEYKKSPDTDYSLKKKIQDLWYSLLDDSSDSDDGKKKKGGDHDSDSDGEAILDEDDEKQHEIDIAECKIVEIKVDVA